MPYIKPEVVAEVKKLDLLTYLRNFEPDELVRVSQNVYTTKTHDSLKISNGLWTWHSAGIGGRSALDYLIKVRGMGFLEAVERITGHGAITVPAFSPAPAKVVATFALPPRDTSDYEVRRYLAGRGIAPELIAHCMEVGAIYQTRNKGYPNCVFVGFDGERHPRYATVRGIRGDYKGDVAGSDKHYSFALAGISSKLHLFESVVDLLSFATLQDITDPSESDMSLLSLSGVFRPRKNIAKSALPKALERYLGDNPETKTIHLHLDNDAAGRFATEALVAILPKHYEVKDEPPPSGKDYNEHLMSCRSSTGKQRERRRER